MKVNVYKVEDLFACEYQQVAYYIDTTQQGAIDQHREAHIATRLDLNELSTLNLMEDEKELGDFKISLEIFGVRLPKGLK